MSRLCLAAWLACRAVHAGIDPEAYSEQSLWTVIVDAGSTGSRLYTYHIDAVASPFSGGVNVRRGDKVKPGLDKFASDHEGAYEQLLDLFVRGAALVPESARRSARAIIRGTGGLRDDLDEEPRDALLGALAARLSADPVFPFSLSREDVGVVSGHDESFYAFASANFLEGKVDHLLRRQDTLIGALDLGGSSTQITYAYDREEVCVDPDLEDDVDECLEADTVGRDELYARSFAGFGAQAVRERASLALEERADPCAHAGYNNGAGDFAACVVAVRHALFGADRALACGDAEGTNQKRSSCALDAAQEGLDALPNTTRFLAMCNYFYAADALRVLAEDSDQKSLLEASWPTPSLDTLASVAEQFCSLPWQTVWEQKRAKHKYTPDNQLATRCFEAAYILVLLRDAYALDHNETHDAPRVTFALDAKGGAEVEWTLGFFLAEIAHLGPSP